VKVLYLSQTGLLEPLGRSQVWAYLEALAAEHEITIVTLEKQKDFENTGEMAAWGERCAAAGVRWQPRRYRNRPRLVGAALNLLGMFWCGVVAVADRRADLVHARSYLPAFVAMALRLAGGKPYIFDTRALWVDELIAAGRLRPKGPLTGLLRWLERRCYRNAAAIVSLTEAAVPHMRETHGIDPHVDIAVVPTCVDIVRFRPPDAAPGAPVFGSVGTVLSGWFLLDWLTTFLKVVTGRRPEAAARIVTRDDPEAIGAALRSAGIDQARISIGGVAPDEAPAVMAGLTAGVMFFESGLAKRASCPTRMGEFLASGLPVVANEGIGDVAGVIRKYDVGVIMTENSPEAAAAALDALDALLRDPELAARCRRAAEEQFALARGVETYDWLYREVGGKRR